MNLEKEDIQMSGKQITDFTKRFAELYSEFVYDGGTQQEFAKIIGVSRQTIGAWLSGDRSPKRPTVENIATKFGVNLAWLNGFDVKKMLL
jgi:transcriptional regulator with XRE-family HTH domain